MKSTATGRNPGPTQPITITARKRQLRRCKWGIHKWGKEFPANHYKHYSNLYWKGQICCGCGLFKQKMVGLGFNYFALCSWEVTELREAAGVDPDRVKW